MLFFWRKLSLAATQPSQQRKGEVMSLLEKIPLFCLAMVFCGLIGGYLFVPYHNTKKKKGGEREK